MAMTVIDLLEAVNVDHEDGQGTAVSTAAKDSLLLAAPSLALLACNDDNS
jgi:hypothetical protein